MVRKHGWQLPAHTFQVTFLYQWTIWSLPFRFLFPYKFDVLLCLSPCYYIRCSLWFISYFLPFFWLSSWLTTWKLLFWVFVFVLTRLINCRFFEGRMEMFVYFIFLICWISEVQRVHQAVDCCAVAAALVAASLGLVLGDFNGSPLLDKIDRIFSLDMVIDTADPEVLLATKMVWVEIGLDGWGDPWKKPSILLVSICFRLIGMNRYTRYSPFILCWSRLIPLPFFCSKHEFTYYFCSITAFTAAAARRGFALLDFLHLLWKDLCPVSFLCWMIKSFWDFKWYVGQFCFF